MAVTADFQLSFGGVDMGDGTDYDVVDIDGLGVPGVRSSDVETLRRHGLHPGDDFVGGRVVTVTLEVDGGADAATLTSRMATLAAALRPGQDESALVFQLPGVAGGGRRRLLVRPRRVAVPVNLQRVYGLPEVVAQFAATDPRIYDDTQSTDSTSLPTSGTGLTWPLTWPLNWGAVGTSGSIFATNAGNFEAPVTIRLDGPVTNPRIENVTVGRTIELDITLNAGEYLEIDTQARTVLLGGTASRYSSLTTTSQWWDLAPGTNEVRFRASTPTAATMTLTWRSAWLA
ncbi:MAG: hypothetical protein D6683_14265 [Actinomyces sp.]|nr:MAG: hypothetical protein D6683_14265 [Actinomyces sp.]